MNSNPKDGGQAFPSIEVKSDTNGDYQLTKVWSESVNGMSLRDYFAGQHLATQSMSGVSPAALHDDVGPRVARACYIIADAMLAERAKEQR